MKYRNEIPVDYSLSIAIIMHLRKMFNIFITSFTAKFTCYVIWVLIGSYVVWYITRVLIGCNDVWYIIRADWLPCCVVRNEIADWLLCCVVLNQSVDWLAGLSSEKLVRVLKDIDVAWNNLTAFLLGGGVMVSRLLPIIYDICRWDNYKLELRFVETDML